MPVAVVGAVAAAAGSALAGTTLFGLSVGLTAALVGASSLALSFLQQGLTPKPDKPNLSSFQSIRSTGVTQQFSQPVVERRIIYGEARVSGPVLYAGVTDNNKYLHLVIALAGHEIEEIGEIIVDDDSIPPDYIDGSGNVIDGRYDGFMRIKKYLGTSTQTADPDLVAEVAEWTTDHRLQETAYIYVRYQWNRDKYPSGIPNISAWVKGKKILDTRDSVTRWSPNIALQTNDYLRDEKYGLKVASANIDETTLNSNANICDEFVTTTNLAVNITSVDTTNNLLTLDADNLVLQVGDRIRLTSGTIGGLSAGVDYYVIPYQRKVTPRIKVASSLANAIAGMAIDLTSGTTGTITKNAEPRYHGGGILKSDSERGSNLRDIYTSMAGQVVYAGGVWRILAGAYNTPAISFDENDIISDITVNTNVSKQDRFNRVQGIYVSPIYDGNPSDYPVVENSTYETEDGEVIKTDLDLAFIPRPHTAQRIAKIYLERMRQEIIFQARFKLTAFKVQVGDNIFLSIDILGWSSKVFEVIDWKIGVDGDIPYIEMVLRENASAVYDWNSGEETQVDPAPNTSLPNPFDVDPPTSLVVTPEEVGTSQGDLTYKFVLTWTAPADEFVISGGFYEVQFKKSSEADYKDSYRVDGGNTRMEVNQVQPGINYDCRIRSVNYLGIKSAYSALLGFTVDSPSGATIQIDYGFITISPVELIDYGLVTETPPDELDYGEVV